MTAPDWGQDHLSLEAVVAYVDGELAAGPHARATQHLGQCPECAAQVSSAGPGPQGAAHRGRPVPAVALLSSLRSIPQDTDLPAAAARAGDDRRRPAGLGAAPRASGSAADVDRPRPPRRPAPVARPVRRPTHRRLRVGTGVAVSGLALGALVFGASPAAPSTPATPTAPPSADAEPGVRRLGGNPRVLDARLQLGSAGPAPAVADRRALIRGYADFTAAAAR